ncbi:transcriptional regulator, Spx/MgsR family [Cohaesibacter marisflavi]|uniref:Transcriptional regulator, Spx/MgsR family n=1 Tax=Cohaesibacter marisflavi TaxID=655353 RepID=A0A1I5D761_9HYPH|nr:Spx/MgsR family RNA polymerase-binding regulatory protein [Cohaesibacter marisflavi]SFN95039.1 transcriptional regulator, Spx/MgsR family [Cohaesibacter marisflavi]
MKLFGIKTCDTCRKALKALENAGRPVSFMDLRSGDFTGEDLDRWLSVLGWEALLNRRSTSWRALDDTEKQDLDGGKARALMLASPTLIKRPVIETADTIIVGFGKAQQDALLKS